MLNKTIFQGLVIVIAFFGMWFGLSQLDFVKFFEIEKHTTSAENKIGDLIWDQIQETEDVITNDSVVKGLDKLILPICKSNDIERDSLKVHIVEKDEVNAFALPNNHLVVYTGLIIDCKKQEALQGVLGHEIAHIEKNDVECREAQKLKDRFEKEQFRERDTEEKKKEDEYKTMKLHP